MSFRLRWTEQAVDQLTAIAEFISITSPIYAEHAVDRIVRRLEQVKKFPESGRVVPEYDQSDIRELIEPPYRLIYRWRGEAVDVLAILHSRQSLGPSV